MAALSDREAGRIENEVETLKHRARNDRMILTALGEELEDLRLEVARLKVRAYTIASAAAVFVSVIVWLVEFVSR